MRVESCRGEADGAQRLGVPRVIRAEKVRLIPITRAIIARRVHSSARGRRRLETQVMAKRLWDKHLGLEGIVRRHEPHFDRRALRRAVRRRPQRSNSSEVQPRRRQVAAPCQVRSRPLSSPNLSARNRLSNGLEARVLETSVRLRARRDSIRHSHTDTPRMSGRGQALEAVIVVVVGLVRCSAPQRSRKPPHIRHRPAFAVRPRDAFYAREILLPSSVLVHFAAFASIIIIDPHKMINASFAYAFLRSHDMFTPRCQVCSINQIYGLSDDLSSARTPCHRTQRQESRHHGNIPTIILRRRHAPMPSLITSLQVRLAIACSPP